MNSNTQTWITDVPKITNYSAIIAGLISILGMIIRNSVIGVIIPLIILFLFGIYLLVNKYFIIKGQSFNVKLVVFPLLKWTVVYAGTLFFFMILSYVAKFTGWI